MVTSSSFNYNGCKSLIQTFQIVGLYFGWTMTQKLALIDWSRPSDFTHLKEANWGVISRNYPLMVRPHNLSVDWHAHIRDEEDGCIQRQSVIVWKTICCERDPCINTWTHVHYFIVGWNWKELTFPFDACGCVVWSMRVHFSNKNRQMKSFPTVKMGWSIYQLKIYLSHVWQLYT